MSAAWKFLRPGRVERPSGFVWPEPGEWTRRAAEASDADALPRWIAEELWRVELREPVRPGPAKLVGAAGRLIARVDAWDADAARAFAVATARRLGETGPAGYARDAERFGVGDPDPFRGAAQTGLIATTGAERAGGTDAAVAELGAQAAWLRARLGLDDHTSR